MSIDTYLLEEPHIQQHRAKIARGLARNEDVSMQAYLLAQIYEVMRHKWFLSEQAGHDVGYPVAIADFSRKYSAAFREHWEKQPVSLFMVRYTPDFEFFHRMLGDYAGKIDERIGEVRELVPFLRAA